MKKLIAILAAGCFSFFGAEAQTTKDASCGTNKDHVCNGKGENAHCYKTKYAQNFKVCKGSYGYFICCQKPGLTNATLPALPLAAEQTGNEAFAYEQDGYRRTDLAQNEKVPQSQSYPAMDMSSERSYEGYYNNRGRIKVCYAGNNVAELNKAPYEGCNTPAYDGQEANNQRNINVSNPVNLPPIEGRSNGL